MKKITFGYKNSLTSEKELEKNITKIKTKKTLEGEKN